MKWSKDIYSINCIYIAGFALLFTLPTIKLCISDIDMKNKKKRVLRFN